MRAPYGTLIVLLNVLAAAVPAYTQTVPSPPVGLTAPIPDPRGWAAAMAAVPLTAEF